MAARFLLYGLGGVCVAAVAFLSVSAVEGQSRAYGVAESLLPAIVPALLLVLAAAVAYVRFLASMVRRGSYEDRARLISYGALGLLLLGVVSGMLVGRCISTDPPPAINLLVLPQ
ncbi:hypothetical protein Ato02nite_064720 [Paractinoplanes toevensis]|uniref:Uncharacterized protein n=1 Tax=Paractinoplanes toevensis TaxID=571911 RepID=A0A919TIH6_9ACTN|nr:hypothetical protein Ato02nite_064720 [Actinoplanes toevensis]